MFKSVWGGTMVMLFHMDHSFRGIIVNLVELSR